MLTKGMQALTHAWRLHLGRRTPHDRIPLTSPLTRPLDRMLLCCCARTMHVQWDGVGSTVHAHTTLLACVRPLACMSRPLAPGSCLAHRAAPLRHSLIIEAQPHRRGTASPIPSRHSLTNSVEAQPHQFRRGTASPSSRSQPRHQLAGSRHRLSPISRLLRRLCFRLLSCLPLAIGEVALPCMLM